MTFPGEQLLIKLWDTLMDKGIVRILEPWQIRRIGKAHADNMILLAQAEKLSNEIKSGKKELEFISAYRITDKMHTHIESVDESSNFDSVNFVAQVVKDEIYDRIIKEINVSKAILHAEEVLKYDSEEPNQNIIDDDWIKFWRKYAGEISKENLQQLWGKILAGELKSPGKFSLRTLDFLRTLSVNDAEFISKMFPYIIDNRIFKHSNLGGKYGLDVSNLLILQELGLVVGAEGVLSVTYKLKEKFHLISNDKILELSTKDITRVFRINCCNLTQLGKEVASIGIFTANVDYLVDIGRLAISQNYNVVLYDYDKVNNRGINGEVINAK